MVPPPFKILPMPIRAASTEIPLTLVSIASGALPKLKYPARLDAPYATVIAPSGTYSSVTTVEVPKYRYAIIIKKGISCFSTEFVTAWHPSLQLLVSKLASGTLSEIAAGNSLYDGST